MGPKEGEPEDGRSGQAQGDRERAATREGADAGPGAAEGAHRIAEGEGRQPGNRESVQRRERIADQIIQRRAQSLSILHRVPAIAALILIHQPSELQVNSK